MSRSSERIARQLDTAFDEITALALTLGHVRNELAALRYAIDETRAVQTEHAAHLAAIKPAA